MRILILLLSIEELVLQLESAATMAVWTTTRAQREEDCIMREARRSTSFFQIEIYKMDSGNELDSRVDTNESSFPRR